MAFIQTNSSVFKKIFVFLLTIIIFSTCSEDPPTEPEKENNIITTATIGVNGGELKTEGFSLFVPAGSFRNETTLSVSISDKDSPFGDNTVSSIFKVKGIPNEFNNAIKIAVKFNGTLSDSSYLAVGEPLSESIAEDIFFLIPANDSSGYLLANLSADQYSRTNLNKSNSTNTLLENEIIGITGEGHIYSEFLSINYPKYLSKYSVLNFAKHLDSTIIRLGENNLELIELNYFFYDPLPILIRDYSDYIVTRKNWMFNDAIFNIDVDLLGSSKFQLAKIKFIGSYLNDIIYKHFDSDSYSSLVDMTNALLLYFEDYLGYSNNNDPPTGIGGEPTKIVEGKLQGLVGNELSLFDGFSLGSYPGLSSLIKYLIDFQNYKISNLGLVFKEAQQSNINHYYSLISKVDNFIADWFPDYYEKYINSQVYKIDKSVFLTQENLGGTFSISSTLDTIKTFTKSYSDLSAKRFIIELNHEYEDESASLMLETSTGANSDGTAILVFGVDANDNLEHLVTARAEPTEIPNLKAYYQNGTKKFLVVVVNCINNGVDYTGNHEITFEVKIEKEKASIEIVDGNYNCYVSRRGIIFDLHEEISGTDGSSETRDYSETFSSSGTVSGVVSGGIFTGVHDDDTTVVTFSSDFKEINYSLVSHYWSGFNSVNSTLRINAVNIPLYSNTPSYQVSGQDVANYISYADYTKSEFWQSGDVYYTKTVTTTGIRFDNSSKIFVVLGRL